MTTNTPTRIMTVLIVVLLLANLLVYQFHDTTNGIRASRAALPLSAIRKDKFGSDAALPGVELLSRRNKSSTQRRTAVVRPGPFPNIQRILYINLDKRKDRRRSFEAAMAQQGIGAGEYVRIVGVINKVGSVGCLKSHIAALRYAQKHFPGETVVVFEDDVVFIDERARTQRRLRQLWNDTAILLDWNVVMFAKNLWAGGHFMNSTTDGVIRVLDALTASAYAIHGDYVQTLLTNKLEALAYIGLYGYRPWFRNDQYCKPLQRKDRWYAFHPPLCLQMKSYSDIEHRVVNYRV